ncbi:MAG: hypothetical protein KGJ86_20320 [Chloroflexota bacterium]|nr:hypothetical protein [Chloroflexota bacterium]
MAGGAILDFALNKLQLIALAVLLAAYVVKVLQLVRLSRPPDAGSPRGSVGRGVLVAYLTLLSPFSMESTRTRLWRWLVFGLYHLGILVAILVSFLIPLAPGVMTWPVREGAAAIIAAAIAAGLIKLVMRLAQPALRLVSTPDDYFSLAALEVWFLLGVPALLLNTFTWLLAYFVATAVLLVYVPFSKSSHYIYWFFSRQLFGQRYGRRGIL